MTRILVDTNVILDVLLARREFVDASSRILALAERGELNGHLCAVAVDTIDYILGKSLGAKAARPHLRNLCRILQVAPVDAGVIEAAFALDWPDLEDAIVYACAQRAGLDALVTRNTKDFAPASVPVFTPEEFLAAWYGIHEQTPPYYTAE